MRLRFATVAVLVMGLGFGATQRDLNAPPARDRQRAPVIPARVTQRLAGLPIPFVANQGQARDEVKFYATTFAGTVSDTRGGELVCALAGRGTRPSNPAVSLTEELVGGTAAHVRGAGATRTVVNVFRGNDPRRWRRNVPTYGQVSLGDVYEGIELVATRGFRR